MGEIQRWKPGGRYTTYMETFVFCLRRDKHHGVCVKYVDHVAVVAKRDARIEELEALLKEKD